MSIERRVKKQILAQPQKVVVRYPRDFEDVGHRELLGVIETPINEVKFTPTCTFDENASKITDIGYRQMIELPMRLAAAREVFWLVKEARVGAPSDLVKQFAKIEWDLIFPKGARVSMRPVSTRSRLYHEGLVWDICRDILIENGFEVVKLAEPSHKLEVNLRENHLEVLVNLAGEHLYKRGYKEHLTAVAPVKEDIAAAAIRLTLDTCKNKKMDLILAPFAGSGTLGFETLITSGFAPCMFGRKYDFEEFVCNPSASTEFVRKSVAEKAIETVPVEFVDTSVEQIEAIKGNIKSFTGSSGVKIKSTATLRDFFGYDIRSKGRIFMPMNPPYGDRLKVANTSGFYQKIAGHIAELSKNNDVFGFIFTPDKKCMDRMSQQLEGWTLSSRLFDNGGSKVYCFIFEC